MPEKGYENHPMQNVSWYGAVAFADWLSKKMQRSVRLPTEAEWEYAAKGGPFRDSFRYAGSDSLEEVGWYGLEDVGWYGGFNNSGNTNSSQPVKQKKENRLGLHDLSGNVWEWCADKIDRRKSVLEAVEEGTDRVLRGGGWRNVAPQCRVASRDRFLPRIRGNSRGFRCAVSPQVRVPISALPQKR